MRKEKHKEEKGAVGRERRDERQKEEKGQR